MSHEESDPTRPNDASSGRSPSPGQLSPEGLRQWAEAVLQRQPEEVRETPGEDIQDLIQKLHVHQVELEMQNEELRRTQWELERSRDRYADLYDFAPVAYLTVSETGMIMEANLTAAATLGVGRGQLIGQPLSRFVHERDQDAYYLHRRRLFEDREPQVWEMAMAREDGSPFWARVEARAREDSQGRTVCRASLSDITERRRTEEALRQSEEKHRRLFETMALGVVYQAADGRIISVNPAAERILGRTFDQMQGKTSMDPHWGMIEEDGTAVSGTDHPAMIALRTGEMVGPVTRGVSRPDLKSHVWLRITAIPLSRSGEAAPSQVYTTFEDITERKRVEEALRKSEVYSRTVIEAIPDIVIQTNVEGEYLDILTGSEDLLFLPREELLGRRMGDVLPEHTAQRMLDAVREALSTKKLRTVSYQLPVAAGNQYFEARIVPLRDEEALALIRDITERKRAEEALADSHQRLELALLGGELGMWDWNPQDGAVIYSDIWAEMLEYRPDEVEPTVEFFERHIHPEDLAAVLDRLTGHVEGRLPAYESEHRLRTKSGKWLWIMDRGKIVERDKDGSPLRVTGTIADITELKEAEQEREHLIAQIHGHAQQMEQVLNSVPTGMLLLDPHHRILLANSAARNDLTLLAGVGMGDRLTHLGERPLEDLLAPPPEGGWHELSAEGRSFAVIARPTGEVDGEDAGWVVVLDDVTEQRQRQAHAERQGRLAAVGQLAGGIAHDFNNIMAVIILYAQTVARSEGLTERDREKMATIHQQGWHATRLIEQLLDFSRQATFEKRPLDLLPLLKEQVKLLERTLPEHIKIVLSHGEDECVVSADLTRMQQMIMNLAVNARDVMPEGGVLRLALERIAVEPGTAPPCPEMEAGEWVKLAISDTGTGIAPDVLQHLFEPFFTTKEPGAGTGLGLAQVHGIVAQHGGHIGVETEVGKGTTFAIYLSALAVRPAVPPTLGDSTVPQGRGEVVLVVEDNDAVRAAIVSSLEQMNYRALEAANGEQALAAMKEQGQQVALVLSDVVMPVMGGLELLRALRQEGGETPVILLSGHGVPPDRDELQAQGVMAWLGKPPSLEQLARAIASALSG